MMNSSCSVPKAQVMLQLHGMDYSLFGYNSLKGCPLTSGRDPGFTLPIFSGGADAVRPDQGVTVTARLGRDKWGPPFSGSQNFNILSNELRQNVLVVSTALCSLYDLTLLLMEPPSFHSSFVDWIIKLNNTDDEDMYIEFLDTYGTHFVSRARFGASITVIHKIEDNVYYLFKKDHLTSAASYSTSAHFGHPQTLTSDQQKAIAEFRNHETTTFAVGVPLPDGGNSAKWFDSSER
ncbi:hypothetical protein C0Q70_12865 [Pomacea canaliculata]|uniref:MACPF domain-containing protein n=1 Tax=Pomacea canaliculata TaxID=400727 RepID=A0A2T7P2Q2_POMCA|nr:hypothetical protein C0Q70_12865 [Pomacea canaliculata]